MAKTQTTHKGPQWPTREVLLGCCLLALAGCGEAGGYLVGSIITAGDRSSSRHSERRGADPIGDPSEGMGTGAHPR